MKSFAKQLKALISSQKPSSGSSQASVQSLDPAACLNSFFEKLKWVKLIALMSSSDSSSESLGRVMSRQFLFTPEDLQTLTQDETLLAFLESVLETDMESLQADLNALQGQQFPPALPESKQDSALWTKQLMFINRILSVEHSDDLPSEQKLVTWDIQNLLAQPLAPRTLTKMPSELDKLPLLEPSPELQASSPFGNSVLGDSLFVTCDEGMLTPPFIGREASNVSAASADPNADEAEAMVAGLCGSSD